MSRQRIDYWDSPDAPRANSLVPSVNVVIVNGTGELQLIRRTDNGNWAVPGGAIDLAESVAHDQVGGAMRRRAHRTRTGLRPWRAGPGAVRRAKGLGVRGFGVLAPRADTALNQQRNSAARSSATNHLMSMRA